MKTLSKYILLLFFLSTNSHGNTSEFLDSFMIEGIDNSGIVKLKQSVDNSFGNKKSLLKTYPLLVYTAEIPANSSNAIIVTTIDDRSVLWNASGYVNIFGLSPTRKINFGVKSCNNSKIYTMDLKKIEEVSKQIKQGFPFKNIDDVYQKSYGQYEINSIYGSNEHFGKIIEIHNSEKDKIIVFANIYDPVETTVNYWLNNVSKNLFGDTYSKYKTVESLIASVTGKEQLKAVLVESEKEAISQCEKYTNNSTLLCKNLGDGIVKYEFIKLFLDEICKSS